MCLNYNYQEDRGVARTLFNEYLPIGTVTQHIKVFSLVYNHNKFSTIVLLSP